MGLKGSSDSPLRYIDVSFANYVAKRRRESYAHMIEGVPDYAFAMDYELKAKLTAIPHFESICKKISATLESREIQIFNQTALAVGPSQFPEIYEMGVDCARRLNIGIPNIFVFSNPNINAFTYATDSVSPMIVLFSGLVDRMKPGELKCVIGHECGHIHNEHSVYKNVIMTLLNSQTGKIGYMLSAANTALMQFWNRASEITADRAALICADNEQDAINVQAKLLSGAMYNQIYQQEIDIESLKVQMEDTFDNPARLYEIFSDHPSCIRRIFATKEFAECDTYYLWRPEMKKPDSILRSKMETDERCKKLINIVFNR